MADDVPEVRTRFQGRVAIITGGGSGLGRLLTHRFAAEGASVVVADLRNASAVAAEISEVGGLSLARTTDVTSATDVKAMVEVARESFGPVDDLHGLRCLSVPYLAGVGLQRDRLPATNPGFCRVYGEIDRPSLRMAGRPLFRPPTSSLLATRSPLASTPGA